MLRLSVSRRIAALVATLLLIGGLVGGRAEAASTVDVTYDLADTSLSALWNKDNRVTYGNGRPLNGTVTGSMKVRYTSDSSSGMPIQTGPLSLLSFNLTIQDKNPYWTVTLDVFSPGGGLLSTGEGALTGTFNWQLATAVTGGRTAGGALTGLSGNLLLTGRANCLFTTKTRCGQKLGLPTQTVNLNYSYTGTFDLAGDAGAYGGASSTPHTLTGSGPINIGFNAVNVGGGFFLKRFPGYDTFGNTLVGREILREAEGKTKVVPEPATFALVGAGLLAGAAARRARRGRSG